MKKIKVLNVYLNCKYCGFINLVLADKVRNNKMLCMKCGKIIKLFETNNKKINKWKNIE